MPKIIIKWRDILLLCIGFILGTISSNWSYFTFSKEISISDIFTAVLGGYLGLYIAGKLTSQTSSERLEKDLMIQELTPLSISLSRLYPIFEANAVSMTDAIQLFKLAGQAFSHVSTLATMCDGKQKVTNLADSLLTESRTLNNMVTNNNINANAVIQIPLNQLPLVKTKLKNLRENTIRLIIAINRN